MYKISISYQELKILFLDDLFSVKGIFSNFLRPLFPILESNKFDVKQEKTKNELVKLTKENKKMLLSNSEKISFKEFSVDVHTENIIPTTEAGH